MAPTADSVDTTVDYVSSYEPKLNPLHARLALLRAGIAPPRIAVACELGFGQGLSLNIHAAASPICWFGTDVAPVHVTRARDLARSSGAAVQLYDQPIEQFADRHPELPDFDYVALHGMWSWVTSEARDAIVQFLRRKLKPSGLLYLNYYARPAWAAFLPLRDLLNAHARSQQHAESDALKRVGNAFRFVENVISMSPQVERRLAPALDDFRAFKNLDPRYVYHELFATDWLLTDFAAVRDRLSPVGLVHAASANFADHTEVLSLSRAERDLLAGLDDDDLRESVRDCFVTRRSRCEYWIKGGARLAAPQRDQMLRELRVVATSTATDLPLQARAVLALNAGGEDGLECRSIMALLSDLRARPLGDVEESLRPHGMALPRIVQAVMLLADFGFVGLAQDAPTIAGARPFAHRLNRALLAESEPVVLASPVTGGGVSIDAMEAAFLRAMPDGGSGTVDRLVARALHDRWPRSEVENRASDFRRQRLPVLKALQVI